MKRAHDNTTHILEEQFFAHFRKNLESKYNLDRNHACDVALEVLELLHLGDSNLEELSLYYS